MTGQTYSWKSQTGATIQDRINKAIQLAAADAWYTPTLDPSGYGPVVKQGVVTIPYDAANPVLALTGPVTPRSNVRLQVDPLMTLSYAWNTDGQLFLLDGVTGFTLTGGTLSAAKSSAGHSRLINVLNADRCYIGDLTTISRLAMVTAAIPFHAPGGLAKAPRRIVYENHTNLDAPGGYGPNQITSLLDSVIRNISGVGGTTLRMETDGATAGIHRVTATGIHGKNGNRAVAMTPHCVNSDTIHVSNVTADSMYAGVTFGSKGPADTCTGGKFTNTVVDGVTVTKGTQAQDPSNAVAPGTLVASRYVVQDNSPSGSSVQALNVTQIGW